MRKEGGKRHKGEREGGRGRREEKRESKVGELHIHLLLIHRY